MSRRFFTLVVSALVVAGLSACGDDDSSDTTTAAAATTTAAASTTTAKVTTTTAKKETTTTRGGETTTSNGGMHAGAPSFTSFEASSSVPCEGGNATVTLKYTTINVVSIAIKIGDGNFESTAGYGPNETDVVAEIPCSGAGSSSVQLKGCTEDNECAESEIKQVTITG